MEISGPSHVLYRDGKPADSYLVTSTEKTMTEIKVWSYYFDNPEDAELYLRYLQQEEGMKNLNRVLASKKVPDYEKKDYRAFKDSIDTTILIEIAKKLNPEKVFNKYKRKK